MRWIAQSVGYGPHPPQKQEHIFLSLNEYTLDEEPEECEEDIFEVLEKVDDDYPSFFPPELLAILPAARRSLILLQKAQPEHSLLSQPAQQAELRWIWRTVDIEAAYIGNQMSCNNTQCIQTDQLNPHLEGCTQEYKSGLEGLEVFDMEPGTFLKNASLASKTTSGSVQDFIDSFPDSLPPITPTFSHLGSVVFSDLVKHSSMLSSTLLGLFLAHTGELNFRSHLVLLRDFLLITSSSFRLKLSFALFSDKEDYEIDNKNRALSLQTLRQRKQITESTQPWAVGLASALLEREIWPPIGADLSFFLRTVIVDSLDYPQGDLPKHVVSNASWRLGFAIRDLPTGPGRDKWLNPLCTSTYCGAYVI